jgi:hypothetical protein
MMHKSTLEIKLLWLRSTQSFEKKKNKLVEALCVCLLTSCKSDFSDPVCAEVLLPDIHVDCPSSIASLRMSVVLRPCTYYN